jgi:mycothiol S-conjugate amidase
MVSPMPRRPCLLAVHAHPDDESSKGAATIAQYAARGVRCVLVSCTDGAAGEMRPEFADEDLATVRARELAQAASILGYDATYTLGFRDSGVEGVVPNGFAAVPIDCVVDSLVAIFRDERPDVVVTYDSHYAARHPDHRRSHEAACLAFERASVDGWRPQKLYGCRTHSPARLRAMHGWLVAEGRVSPYASAVASAAAAAADDPTTTRITVADSMAIAQQALRAHRSQVTPDDAWFFSVPLDVMQRIHPYDDYVLLQSHVARVSIDDYERDLFDGIEDLVIR